jgi:molybdenum cofactor cytidylyltransferase
VIAGLLLASGASRRFGANKLVAPLDGRPMVRWSAEALASAVDAAYVVVPSQDREIRAALRGLRLHWVENADATEGMASSIRAGVATLPAEAEAVVITLGDQPLIDGNIIRNVLAAWRTAPPRIRAVAAEYEDGRGHPVLFGAALFADLKALEGDRGARELLASLGESLAVVRATGVRPADVDTPDALAALERGGRQSR